MKTRRAAQWAAAVLLAVGLAAAPAWAQDNLVLSLAEQLQQLRDQLNTLQGDYYSGRLPPARVEAAREEQELAARVQAEQAAQFEVRLNSLETEIRNLTGTVERFGFTAEQNRQRIERVAEDLEFRLSAIEQQLSGLAAAAPAGPQPAAPPGGLPATSTATAPPASARPAGGGFAATESTQGPVQVPPGGEPGAAGARVLGVLPSARPDVLGIEVSPPVPEDTRSPQEQYDDAYGLLQQFRAEEAEVAFRAFVEQNPGHELVANARYWLGETLYSQGEFEEAARVFYQSFDEAPQAAKAPENFLKLGMSLARMDQTEEACVVLGALGERFPDANVDVRTQATAERRRLTCQ